MRWTNRHGWRRHAFRVTATTTLFTLIFSTASVRAADPAPTNLDLLAHMTTEIANELYTKFGPELGDRPVALRPFSSGEDYVFVGNVFMNVLTSHDVTTIAPPAGPARSSTTTKGAGAGTNTQTSADPANVDPNTGATMNPQATTPPAGTGAANIVPQSPNVALSNAVTLTFQNVAFAMSYPDVYRSHLVGGRKIKRRADVRVHATITDAATGQVLWVGEAAREHEDEFDYGDSARVEQGAYPFARPILPGGGWGKYAEPVFVTGIIVGLIYLFFSNQSDN